MAYYLWFVAAVALVIVELNTGTFYLLMVAVGLAAGGVGALLDLSPAAQTVTAALVAAVLIAGLRRTRFGKLRRGNAAADPNVNLDIGQELDVPAWDANGRARVPYRGADWTVELAPNCAATPGRYRIVEVRGSTLVVSPR
ncbi:MULTISPECIES: NfeD family protein [unclassified Cupriavidus]|uniref:NfeD family protein n=1 Tax=unclassified Cupriavidus TaxID=2640874 RepID=UPI00040F20F4|nr:MULTISPECIES: NfeD family protein [unclassified Cupriavidus]MBP0630953.1 NfeD family protein [Cupriavidus sp. AcVe19-1a]MBP0634126.1 NfeD family protein [Cupriavidus sp. AcVe19-6a]